MEFYFAPMEGLTDRIFRRLHSRYFPGIDRYYMPFYSPTMHRTLSAKESRELPPAAEDSLTAIPQILTRNPEDFLWAAAVCRDLGYPEVNLNVGCPSGSGMLRDLEELRRFLDQVFSAAPLPVSIKTRIGLESPSEFPGILSIYNKYPLALLIVHPRVRSQYYKGEVNRDSFAFATASSRNPLCYNGDILCTRQITDFARDFPEVPAIMIGRGLLGKPWLLQEIETGVKPLFSLAEIVLEHYDLLLDYYGKHGVYVARKHLAWYARGKKRVAEFCQSIYHEENIKAVKEKIRGFFGTAEDEREITK